jgi:hypothetical protein
MGLMRDQHGGAIERRQPPEGRETRAVLHAVAARPGWKLIRSNPAHTGQASISGDRSAGEAQAMGA